MEMEFKVAFNTHGFAIGTDISEEEWHDVQAEYMTMYVDFANKSDSLLEKINYVWVTFEHAKEMAKTLGSDVTVELMAASMGIQSNCTYNDWIEKWYKEIAVGIDAAAAICNFKLRSNIFRDDDVPLFGVKFKDHPEWTVDFTLEPVKN